MRLNKDLVAEHRERRKNAGYSQVRIWTKAENKEKLDAAKHQLAKKYGVPLLEAEDRLVRRALRGLDV